VTKTERTARSLWVQRRLSTLIPVLPAFITIRELRRGLRQTSGQSVPTREIGRQMHEVLLADPTVVVWGGGYARATEGGER
jgi:hypothetical protein